MSVAIQYRSQQLPEMEPSSELLRLIDIFEPDKQVVVVRRNPDPVIDAYLAAIAHRMGSGFRHVFFPVSDQCTTLEKGYQKIQSKLWNYGKKSG